MSAEADFWTNAEQAQQLERERGQLAEVVNGISAMSLALEEVNELADMAAEEGDTSILGELDGTLGRVARQLDKGEFARMMNSPNDASSAILQVNAGAGGTESCDWAAMLMRMYTRWADASGFRCDVVDVLVEEEAGIKSAVLKIEGQYAFGYLKAENGVHRLVRISPFDAAKRRHTSFCSVFVLPVVDDAIDIDIDEGDLRVDTYRASGAGGQHINKTDSAVRITHLPSGIVVSCQAERSQHKNRSVAMKVLASRLVDLERKKRAAERDVIEAAKLGINFGSQIRSYVLAPYRMVKDHRTGEETGNTDAVLDGDIDAFIKAYLLHNAGRPADPSQGPRG